MMPMNFSQKSQKLDTLEQVEVKKGAHFSFQKKPGFCKYFYNGKKYNFYFIKRKKMREEISNPNK